MYRKRFIRFLFTIQILIITILLACDVTVAESKSFLWKVQSKTGVVYILGSIHALKKDVYPLKKTILDAYGDSDILVVEANISDIKPETMQNALVKGSMYSGEGSLRARLSRDTYKQTELKFLEYGVSLSEFDMFKPHFIAITLTAFEMRKQGFDPEFGIDRYFLDKANEDNKEILELESFDFQAGLFNGFSDKEQELFLIYTLMDIDLIGSRLDSLMDSWLNGDADTMESILTKSIADRPELKPVYGILIDNRNTEMAAKLERYLATGNSYFVVIGAAHLIGDKGLINLLKEKGYAITHL